jgi:hypothetical protein
MIYMIRLDPGSIEERLFVAPKDQLEKITEDLQQYCAEMDVDGPYDFVEIPSQLPTYDPQEL